MVADGTGAGLKGWNCRHDFYPFIPGISERAYTDEELKNIDPPPFEYEGKTYDAYEASQMQRRMETEMRKTKRELIGFENAGLDDDYTAAAIKLRRQKEYYKDFSGKAGLPLQNERTQVLGFGRKEAQKAVWAEKKSVVGGKNGGIINVERSKVTKDGRYAITQKRIDDLLETKLKGINFTNKPVYNPRIRDYGKTTIQETPYGLRSIVKVEIGPQANESDAFLIDTIVHEELEARIGLRKTKRYEKLDAAPDRKRHEYINKVISRYFKAKGW